MAAAANSLTSPWHSGTPRRPAFTNLHQSILDGRHQQVQYMVNRHGSALDVPDLYGRTPLTLACLLTSKPEASIIVKQLLRAGFNMHRQDSLGRTAIMYAIINDHEKIVKRMIADDITSLKAVDNDQNTPLIHAASNGNPRIVKLLVDAVVKYNFPIDHKNNLSYTAFNLACKNARYIAAYILYQIGGASASVRDGEFYRTPIEWIKEHMKHLPEGGHESKAHTSGDLWAHPPFEIFNREETLSTYYRQRTIQCSCKHERHMHDPFQTPARLHHSLTLPDLPEGGILSSARVLLPFNVTEKPSKTQEENNPDDIDLTEDAARNILLVRLDQAEKRQNAKTGQRDALWKRLPTAKLVERQPKFKNLSTKEALHTMLDLYGEKWLQLRTGFNSSVMQVELPFGRPPTDRDRRVTSKTSLQPQESFRFPVEKKMSVISMRPY